MKNIVVLSDTHGRKNNVKTLAPIFADADFIVHLGDGAADVREFQALYPDKTFICRGNCDFFTAGFLPEGELTVEGVKFFFCHGDKYRVKSTYQTIVEEAKKRKASVALFGHTHRAEIREQDGVLLVNPGSFSSPKGFGGTYAYLSVSNGKAYPVIVGDDFI